MPTTVTKKIGVSNSPTVMDYSSLAAWAAACPSNLVTADQIWRGECYDQGKFTAAGSPGSGVTTDSTRYVVLTCAAGQSFNAKAGVRTTPLFYNSTTGSGVAVEPSLGDILSPSAQYTVIDGLQVYQTGYGVGVYVNAAHVTVRNCIVTRPATTGTLIKENSTSNCVVANCLLIYRASSGTAYDGDGALYNCTFVNTGSAGSTAAVKSEYNAQKALNCAFFGFSAVTLSPTTFSSSSDYNATDLSSIATAGGGGTHNVTSLTYASQFTSTTSDFRATYLSGLLAGTPDATNAPLDISLFTRSLTTPYIGAWEATAPPPQDTPELRGQPFGLSGQRQMQQLLSQ